MELREIESRIAARLGIKSLLPMQRQMADIKLPARVLLCAPTGSGKTLAFAIAALRALDRPDGNVGTMVITPTRELTLQVYEILRTLAAPEFKTTALYGGHSFAAEAQSLEGKPEIIVGTPGRLLDHVKRGRLSLYNVRTLVIDEYDKALELGFHDDMKALVGRAVNLRNLVLTSATKGDIPEFVGEVKQMLDYSSNAEAQPDIEVFEVRSATPDKLDTLTELLHSLGGLKTIVFLNHRDAAERVYNHLQKEHFPAGLYHGGLEQAIRERSLILFNNGTTPILVATDLAARGLDIDEVGAVIHYHLPIERAAWTHRNGRTARMGAQGAAYAIISENDKLPEFARNLAAAKVEPSDATWQPMATLYLNAGKKEKISRGDIVGYLCQKGGLTSAEIGKIDIRDHCAYVAVPADKARATAVALSPHKLKNTRVRVTQLKL